MKPSFEEAYLTEIILQADYAVLSTQQVNKLLQDQANSVFVFREMYALLSHAAGASRILWPPWIRDPDRREISQAETIYGIRSASGKIILSEFASSGIISSTSTNASIDGLRRRPMVESSTSMSVRPHSSAARR